MKNKIKILIIVVMLLLIGSIFRNLIIEKTKKLSNNLIEEYIQNNNYVHIEESTNNIAVNQENVEPNKVKEEIKGITVNHEGNRLETLIEESTEESVPEEDGKAIILYQKGDLLTNAQIKKDALVNNYKIEDSIDITEESENKESSVSVAVVSSNKASTSELVEKLNKNNWVISAIPDYTFKTTQLTNDEYANIQWAIQNEGQFAGIKGKDIASITTSSKEEKVIAIIDTGVDYTNEDLVNVMWKNPFDEKTLPGIYGYDFVNKDNDPIDDQGHGTHCAGIIAAETNNGVGISGAVLGASNVKIMALKAGDANGNLSASNVISAYQYILKAQELGVNIVAINNSWGSEIKVTSSQEKAIQQLKDLFNQFIQQVGENGAVSVFAAGNSGLKLDKNGVYNNGSTSYLAFPACLESDFEITVAASDSKNELAYFSNHGEVVDVIAPGVDIYSTCLPHSTFNPMSTKKEEYCIFEDFEEEKIEVIDKFDTYIVSSTSDGLSFEDASDITSYEITQEQYYGDSKKALKITVDNSGGNRNIVIRLPLEEIGITRFNKYAVSLDLYAIQNTNGGGTQLANCGFKYNGAYTVALENENISSYYNLGSKTINESSYWSHLNKVYDQKNNGKLEFFDIIISSMGTGIYTLYLDNLTITKDLGDDYANLFEPYALKSGTSMSTPYVTASVAVASNLYETYTADQIKELIINGTTENEKFAGKIKYGALNIQSILAEDEMGLVYGDTNYKYDGREYSINFNVVKPTNQYEVYYSLENEVTKENYKLASKTKPTFTNVGKHIVYWYVHSSDETIKDVSGKTTVNITPASVAKDLDNDYLMRELTGEWEGYGVNQLKLDKTSYKYTGEEINPIEKLIFKGQELIKDKDYIVKYYLANYDSNNAPTYEIEKVSNEANNVYFARITGIGNFDGQLSTEEFTIEPRNITIKANAQKIVEGYQIKVGLEQITIEGEGLAEKQEVSAITLEQASDENGQEIIKASNAIIKNDLNKDVTSNYNINYKDGELTIFDLDEVIMLQFNDIALYDSIILGKNIETLYEDKEKKIAICEKKIIEAVETLELSDNYGKISDLTGLSSFYNLKKVKLENSKVNDISEVLELPNITELEIKSLYILEELEVENEKLYLPQIIQTIGQIQDNNTIKAYIHYEDSSEMEISINKNETEKLYVMLDNNVKDGKRAGNRTVYFKVVEGIADNSTFSVAYTVEEPLTNFETIQIEENEYIVLTAEDDNTVENILTEKHFPNTKYQVRAIDGEGNLLTEDEKIGTGTRIQILSGEEKIKTYYISIKGDIDCDGLVNLYDILKLIELVFDTESSYVWNETLRLAGKCVEDTEKQNPDLYDILRLIEYHFDNVKF